jgi:hypothetical protein
MIYELPTIPRPTKKSHSFSALNTFATICERRYALERNRPWTDTPATLRGTQVHEALEWVAKHFDASLDIETQLTIAADEFHDASEGSQACLERCGQPWPLKRDILLKWLLNTVPAWRRLTPLECEFWVRRQIPGCAWPLNGKVDLNCKLDGLPTILDWKSTANMRKVLTQYECDRSLQGRIYSWCTGIRRVAFAYFSQYQEVEIVTSTYSEEDIDEVALWVAVTAKAVEDRWNTGSWTLAQPTCGLCSKLWCPEWEECVGCVRTNVGV